MKIVRKISELRKWLHEERKRGVKIGLVPTMGSIHLGHISLVKLALRHADSVIVSIFVNPMQFAAHEDFEKYPRNEELDSTHLKSAGVSVLFVPDQGEMFTEGHSTVIDVGCLGKVLEGEFRPNFFHGVATIVTKLLIQVLPDIAIFGEKDFQQLCVIRRLVEDLNLPVEVLQAATVRENDGLAISSRNRYLSDEERICAPILYKVICSFAKDLKLGYSQEKSYDHWASHLINHGFCKIDYLEARDSKNLEKVQIANRKIRILAAAWLGNTRLIDNIAL